MLKQCIWCRKAEKEVSFKKLAHTIPKSLGGQFICENVCDPCNSFFGNHYNGCPSVETIIKEAFIISKVRLLRPDIQTERNKSLKKLSTIYFNIDLTKNKITLKISYQLQKGFQEKIARQIKKGLYKIFLEETERQTKDGLNPKYDFIREFTRYDIGDYPVFYFDRSAPIIFMSKGWAKNPVLLLAEEHQMKYLVREPSFVEFEFLGHVFGIATSRYWEITFDSYKLKTMEAKKDLFRGLRLIKYFNDIDLGLTILDK